ncbi:MAG: hypothetical protein VW008_01505 [Aquiluna sp.]
MRRPLPSKLFRHGTRTSFFATVVADTAGWLSATFEELRELKWKIEDVPPLGPGDRLRRSSSDKQTMTITLYRIPIERLGKNRIPDPRIQIEQAVVGAAAELIDKDPWELIHPD